MIPIPKRIVPARPWASRRRKFTRAALLAVAVAGVAALAPPGAPGRENDQQPAHHTEDGFQNVHPHEDHGYAALIKWRWDRLWGDMPEGPQEERTYYFPLAENDPEFLRANRSQTTATWVGHATLLLQVGGVNILTDPMFSERASPLSWTGPKRYAPLGLAMEDLPPIDVVLLSHNHYDSLDVDSVDFLKNQRGEGLGPRFYVPLGVKEWFEDRGVADVVELDWWESDSYLGMEFHAVPTQHFSARTPFDRDETLWVGWVAASPDFRFYFAGDTGYSPDFAEIGRRLGPMDLSAIPIGAYAPRWFMKPVHVNPEEAVAIHRDVGSRWSVAIHWGTFALTDEPYDEPPLRLAEAERDAGMAPGTFFTMMHGETRNLTPLFAGK